MTDPKDYRVAVMIIDWQEKRILSEFFEGATAIEDAHACQASLKDDWQPPRYDPPVLHWDEATAQAAGKWRVKHIFGLDLSEGDTE